MRAARPGDATGVTIVAIVGGSLGVGLVALAALSGCSRESEQAPVGALVEAAARGDAVGVRDLLDQGADVNGKDETGRTAVTAAVYAGSREIVRLLVAAGADVDIQDETRSNAFLALGETGDVGVLDEVLPARPDVTLTNRFGGTALIPAADRGHVAMVQALLDRTDVDVDHVNDLGWTALLEAVILGDGGRRAPADRPPAARGRRRSDRWRQRGRHPARARSGARLRPNRRAPRKGRHNPAESIH